ncbi:MAG: hypothetical protein ABWX74_07940 [Aeromicrobium sp.]
MTQYFTDMQPARRLWEGAGGAVVTGVICGVLATTTTWAYVVALVLTIIGGLPAGPQHRTVRGAALRGVVAGALWALALLAAIGISGKEAVEAIPRPLWTILVYAVVLTAVVSIAAHGVVRRRTGDSAASPTTS